MALYGFIAARNIVRRNRENLLVEATIVLHDQNTDRTTVDDGAGHDHSGVADQHVDGVAIFGQRVRNEPVVARVPHRCIEEPIDEKGSGLLIELVLDGFPAYRDLDNDVDVLGWVFPDGNRFYTHGPHGTAPEVGQRTIDGVTSNAAIVLIIGGDRPMAWYAAQNGSGHEGSYAGRLPRRCRQQER